MCVLVNPALPGLVTMGCMGDFAEQRATQPSDATAVPQPFIVGCSVRVCRTQKGEPRVLSVLASQGLHVTLGCELCRTTSSHAINTLLTVVRQIERGFTTLLEAEATYPKKSREAEAVRQSAQAFNTGRTRKAVVLHKLVLAHHPLQAHLELGRLYAWEEKVQSDGQRKGHDAARDRQPIDRTAQ